jgi:hypothetical protein
MKNNWDCGIITDRVSDGARGYTRGDIDQSVLDGSVGVDETPTVGRGRDWLAVLADGVEVLLAGFAANCQQDIPLRVSCPTRLRLTSAPRCSTSARHRQGRHCVRQSHAHAPMGRLQSPAPCQAEAEASAGLLRSNAVPNPRSPVGIRVSRHARVRLEHLHSRPDEAVDLVLVRAGHEAGRVVYAGELGDPHGLAVCVPVVVLKRIHTSAGLLSPL